VSIPDLSFVLPNLGDPTVYPPVAHAPTCTDTPPVPSTCFPDTLTIVRPFALPTEPLGQLTQQLTALRNLIPSPPTVGVQCPSLRFDLVAANQGTLTGSSPEVDYFISRPEGDACLPIILPQLTFPCTSITATADGTVSMVNGPTLAGVDHVLTQNDTDRTCSTNLLVNVAVPCVVPDLSAAAWDSVQPGGAANTAANAQYVVDNTAYGLASATYTAAHALYVAQLATYTSNLVTYNSAYATFLTAMDAWRLAVQQQPQPMPLPAKPAAPIPPVRPSPPVGPPVAPVAPSVSNAEVKTVASPISYLISGCGISTIAINAPTGGFMDGDEIQIGGEQMSVVAIAPATFTVVRGIHGTGGQTHNAGDAVTVCTPKGGQASVLVSGPPCNRQLTLGLKIRMPSSVGGVGGGTGSSTGGGGFTVGTTSGALSPFTSGANGASYPPLSEVPIVDTAGVSGTVAAGTQIDPTANLVVNQTNRTLAQGDIVTAWMTNQPPVGSRAVWAIV
jgi:hypothetical protein